MTGIKIVDSKKYCMVCEKETDGKENFCTNCGNPLKLESVDIKVANDLGVIDNFIREVIGYSKRHNCSISVALEEVRKTI